MLIRYNVFKEVELRIKSLIAGVAASTRNTTRVTQDFFIRTATTYAAAALTEGQRTDEFHVFKDTTAHAIK